MKKCPNCGNDTISNLSKFFLGPATEIKCKECGARITVPMKSLLLFLPYLIVCWIGFMLGDIVRIPMIIGISVLFVWIYYKYVPLVKS